MQATDWGAEKQNLHELTWTILKNVEVITWDLLNKMLGKSQVDSLPNGGLKVIHHGKKKWKKSPSTNPR